VPARPWDAPRARSTREWTMLDVSPGQVAYHHERESLSCSIIAPPAGFEPAHTAPESNPAYRRYQHERGLMDSLGAHLGRANCRPQLHRLPPLRPMIRKPRVALAIMPA
jgi:hypothetical protein